jgi:hypothetical protein
MKIWQAIKILILRKLIKLSKGKLIFTSRRLTTLIPFLFGWIIYKVINKIIDRILKTAFNMQVLQAFDQSFLDTKD